MKKLALIALLLVSTPALAQNAPSGSPRVQGVPDGYGDPVQVTIVGADGSGTGSTAVTATGNVAHDAADSGSPIKMGGIAGDVAPTAVANADRVNAWFGRNGNQMVGGLLVVGADDYSSALNLFPDGTGGAGRYTGVALGALDGAGGIDRLRGDTNGLVVLPGLGTTYWNYTSGASPILSNTTTAVTIKTAAGASVRNFIDSCQITTTAFGASVPLAIRDGAAGTVLFALTVPTAGFLQPTNIVFQMPLRGTANTLLEVVTTTANTSGTVTLNCQGHTGA